MTEELQVARMKAWSVPGAGKPPGDYLGCINQDGHLTYYYKDGERYWFENEFDRAMREEERRRRRQAGRKQPDGAPGWRLGYASGNHNNRRKRQ